MRANDIERIWETWDQIAAIKETAVSDTGGVEATVDARGDIQALRLDPRRYRRLDSTTLADTIVATITQAAHLARQRAFDSMAPLLPQHGSFENTDLALDPVRHHLADDR